jgi:cholesterol transport system auxiliary component
MESSRSPVLASLAAIVTAAVLSGCALTRSAPQTVTYDLGPAAALPAPNAGAPSLQAQQKLPSIRIAQTDGPTWMDGNSLYYRLQYAQAQRLQPYATQRWVMSPTRLFDDRLREAVAARGALTWFGDTSVPALKVDMLEFEQVFDSATTSHGVVRVRATVYLRGMIGQQTFEARQPAPSADGAGGVKALADGSDAVIGSMLDWLATLPLKTDTKP